MQKEFDENFPELGIFIVGINERGQEPGNVNITEQMPWLQDVDANADGQGDVWQLWNVQWRDLIILDRNNVPVVTYNLSSFDLADPDNYAEVREAFLSIANTGELPEGEAHLLSAPLVDAALALENTWK